MSEKSTVEARALAYEKALREVRLMMFGGVLGRTNTALRVVRCVDVALASNQDSEPKA